MALFTSLKLETMNDLFLAEIKDLYDAEHQIVKALPQMREAAHSSELKQAFSTHQAQTEQHVQRLEQVFRMVGQDPERETCQAMKGLISEGNEMISAKGDPDVKDAALIAAAQRVEHYEMSGYGSARTFAHRIGRSDVAQILDQTLDEEKQTDKLLSQIAESSVNIRAQRT
jgi:ferritin-like metal-binding protein YciE